MLLMSIRFRHAEYVELLCMQLVCHCDEQYTLSELQAVS